MCGFSLSAVSSVDTTADTGSAMVSYFISQKIVSISLLKMLEIQDETIANYPALTDH